MWVRKELVMTLRRRRRAFVGFLGAVAGCALAMYLTPVLADIPGTERCEDCANALPSCCKDKYPDDRGRCLSCCEKTFGAYAPSGCYDTTKSTQCNSACPPIP